MERINNMAKANKTLPRFHLILLTNPVDMPLNMPNKALSKSKPKDTGALSRHSKIIVKAQRWVVKVL